MIVRKIEMTKGDDDRDNDQDNERKPLLLSRRSNSQPAKEDRVVSKNERPGYRARKQEPTRRIACLNNLHQAAWV